MTVKELMEKLNEMVLNGEIDENAMVRNAEDDDVFSLCDDKYGNVIIYF